MAGLGALIMAAVAGPRVDVLGRQWDLHAMIAGSLLLIVGTQVVALGLCAHAYGMYFMGEADPWFERMRARFRLEHGLLLGGGVGTFGLILGVGDRRHLDPPRLRQLAQQQLAIVAATLMIVGAEIFFSSFLLSILGLRRRD